MVPVLKNVVEGSTAKNYRPFSLLFVVSKFFEKLVNIRIVDNVAFFLISNMVLGLFGQLQIFLQLYLIELLGLFFSVIDSFKWFWMGSILHKKIQLLLEFLKAPVLVLHFSYYALMTFLMILSVILLSMLMILLSILSVIRHLICGNSLNWLLNLNLIYETLWTRVRSGLLISMLGKLNLFCLTALTTVVLLM